MFKHNRFKSRSTYHRVTFLLLYLTWVRSVRALPSPFKSMHQKSLVGGGGEIIAHRRVVADTSKVTNLTRQHNGDIFFSYGKYLTPHPRDFFLLGQSVNLSITKTFPIEAICINAFAYSCSFLLLHFLTSSYPSTSFTSTLSIISHSPFANSCFKTVHNEMR